MTRSSQQAPRRPGLLDAMIGIAAVAVGFAAVRESGQPGFWEEYHSRAYYYLVAITFAANKMLVPISAGWLLARLRRPGPSPRRIWRRPGAVACTTAVILHGLDCAHDVIEEWVYLPDGPSLHQFFWLANWLPNPESIGRAIGLAWLLLAAGGRFRPERGLFDRIGIAIGLGWITCGLVHAYSHLVD